LHPFSGFAEALLAVAADGNQIVKRILHVTHAR
jgi:hypothetical protein